MYIETIVDARLRRVSYIRKTGRVSIIFALRTSRSTYCFRNCNRMKRISKLEIYITWFRRKVSIFLPPELKMTTLLSVCGLWVLVKIITAESLWFDFHQYPFVIGYDIKIPCVVYIFVVFDNVSKKLIVLSSKKCLTCFEVLSNFEILKLKN